MLQIIENVNTVVNNFIWGVPAMVCIIGVGLYLSLRTGFIQVRKFGYALKCTIGRMFKKKEASDGTLTPFQAVCTALAATVGTGNIAGVAGAIAIGGPGAVFWMWISALLGMCTKFSEVVLAVHFRERNERGDLVGGPMYYIKNGLGKNWKWLGIIFAIFGALAAFGIGNMTQVNTIASTINTAVSQFVETDAGQQLIIAWVVSIICSVICGIVLLGGVERLADVCALLVPVMAVIYIIASIIVIAVNITAVPAAFGAIIKGAFNPSSVAGGLAGVGIKTAFIKGVGRGIFSNEAGLGSAPIAHAAADVDHPVKQGMFGVFEVFMDTIVVCTMTALVAILGNGLLNIEYGNDIGAALTINGFIDVFPGKISATVVAICLSLFAISTVLTWALYGSRCVEFLFGFKASKVYQIIFCGFACIAGAVELKLAWAIADTLNGLMAIPNLIAVALLSPVVIKLTREYFQSIKAGK